MNISLRLLNRYLDPGDLTADQAEEILTGAGFPIESRSAAPGGDTVLDVEVTSNRGDLLSHLGMAREVSACTPRRLRSPEVRGPARSGRVADLATLRNTTPEACPRFTLQVIAGVKVGPSPAWLVEALEALGQRSINNVVDVTNFVTLEFGQPSHVFDLDRLAGRTLEVRWARAGETLRTLDGKPRTLSTEDLVVADAQRAQSLAGVIGGAETEVGPTTTNVALEAATWEPAIVRRMARRHQVRTDASHRFERLVDARTIDEPAARLAALIVELAGGRLAEGMLDAGRPREPLRVVQMRPDRCRLIAGVAIDERTMIDRLGRLGVVVEASGGVLRCTIPAHRPDLEREIDLIEEVVRTVGLAEVPVPARVEVTPRAPQATESAMRELGHTLAGLGFFESVTYSFITLAQAAAFMPPGAEPLAVDDARRKGDGVLRPSIIPSLLACRRANQDALVTRPGGVRLFETAATFSQRGGALTETRRLAMLADVPGVGRGKAASIDQRSEGVRLMRGAVESVVRALAGPHAALEIDPEGASAAGLDPDAVAEVRFAGRTIGAIGLVTAGACRLMGVDAPVAAAELDLDPLVAAYPPAVRVRALPQFPAIERDLSLIVDEGVPWSRIASLVAESRLDKLDDSAFVGAYRGRQIGAGKKSVTLRLRFRDASRTLRHEEVDPMVDALVSRARKELGADLRA